MDIRSSAPADNHKFFLHKHHAGTHVTTQARTLGEPRVVTRNDDVLEEND